MRACELHFNIHMLHLSMLTCLDTHAAYASSL